MGSGGEVGEVGGEGVFSSASVESGSGSSRASELELRRAEHKSLCLQICGIVVHRCMVWCCVARLKEQSTFRRVRTRDDGTVFSSTFSSRAAAEL